MNSAIATSKRGATARATTAVGDGSMSSGRGATPAPPAGSAMPLIASLTAVMPPAVPAVSRPSRKLPDAGGIALAARHRLRARRQACTR